MNTAVWTEHFRVRSYEADSSGRASIQNICNYLQEAASNHAAELGVSIEQLTDQQLVWMLARLHVQVDEYPGWREEVTVETWPSGADLLYATRDFNVRTGAGTLARGTSAWLLVDANRRRPIRVPDFIKRIELPERERVLEDRTDKLPDPPDSAEEHPVRVRYSDQDLIGHVNNVLYIDWAVESVPLVETHVVQSLEAQFRAEAHYGDLVTVRTGQTKRPGEFLHLVKSEDLELARIRTTWRPR